MADDNDDPVGNAVRTIVLDDLAEHGAKDLKTDTTKLSDLHWDSDEADNFLGRVHNALLENDPSYNFKHPPPKVADALGSTIDDLIGVIADNTNAA